MNELMRNMVRALSLMLVVPLLVVGQPTSSTRDANEDAVANVVQTSIDEILATLTNEGLSPKARREKVKKTIDDMADLELLAKLVLGKGQWSKIDAAQRKAYTELFVETIRQSTYEKLALFTDEKVEVDQPELLKTSGSPKYRVVTWIISRGERIELTLMLAQRDKRWRVYDLEIEGVSIRKSYSSQYADFLRVNDFPALLAEMQTKIDEARARMAAEDDAKDQPAR